MASKNEVAAFSKEAAQKIKQAAQLVLNGGDYGSVDNTNGNNGLQCITVKLLAKDSDKPAYTWQQERRTVTGWEEISNGLTDKSGKFKAYDVDAENSADLTNAHVVIVRGVLRNESGDIQPIWFIVSDDIGNGEYQYMLLQMVSQNQRGWDYARAHPANP